MPSRRQPRQPEGLPDATQLNARLRGIVRAAYRLGRQRLPDNLTPPELRDLDRQIREVEVQVQALWQRARWTDPAYKDGWVRGMVRWVREHAPADAPDIVLDTWDAALRSFAEACFPGDQAILRELDRLLPSRRTRPS